MSARVHAFADVFRNPNLRRLELGMIGSTLGHWGYAIALAVYAFDAGGAALVGIAAGVRLFPTAIAAPFGGVLADRFPRRRVMTVSALARAALNAGAAVAVGVGAAPAVVLVLIGFKALATAPFEPARAAIVPALAQRPEELTAANVAGSAIESTGIFLGPALGGLLLAVSSVQVVFTATALALLWAALLIARIDVREERTAAQERPVAEELLAGFRTIGSDRRLRLFVGVFSAQTLVAGALNVLIVVMALSLFDLGAGGPGYLTSAVGVGGLIGILAGVAFLTPGRLATSFCVAMILWGVPIAVIGLSPSTPLAIAALVVVGVTNTVGDVAGFTLMQRVVPDDVLARAFGVLHFLLIGGIALGGMLTPLLIDAIGIRGALITSGALLPVLTLLAWGRLRSLDTVAAPEHELALLRGLALFAPLAPATLEHLAQRLTPVEVAAGSDVFRQGDAGDRFYVLDDGEVDVFVDGLPIRREQAGQAFGEIALLRDVPRTATVTARGGVRLYALDRDAFLAAVAGHADSTREADNLVSARLAHARPGVASV